MSVFFSFSNTGGDYMWDWPNAQFLTPLGFEPLDVSLFKGLTYQRFCQNPVRAGAGTWLHWVMWALGKQHPLFWGPIPPTPLVSYLITVLLGSTLWDSPPTELFPDICEEWGPVLPLTPGPHSEASSLLLACPSCYLPLSFHEPPFFHCCLGLGCTF